MCADHCRHRTGIVEKVGNRDFFFVTDLDSGELFFCHHSNVAEGIIPRVGDRVTFDFLPVRVNGKNRPVSRLEVQSHGGVA